MNGDSVYRFHEFPWHMNPEYRLPVATWKSLPNALHVKSKRAFLSSLDAKECRLMDEGVDVEQLMWRRYKMFSMNNVRFDNAVV